MNGSAIRPISSIVPDNEKLSYDFKDIEIKDGNSLYRVKVILYDGKLRYSNTVALVYNTNVMLITSIAPNPVHHSAFVTISSPGTASVKLMLYDAQGKIVRQWQQQFTGGTNVFALQLADLVNGIYFLSGTDGNFKINVTRLVKQ
ncbi:MAG: hypothetical protein JWM28_3210 [Chitinophagaceae bacterium]|nr:hypothetical protein [Chitinophagaceae bacterium]